MKKSNPLQMLPMAVVLPAVLLAMHADGPVFAEDWPDIRAVAADLIVPQMQRGEAAAGQRIRLTAEGWDNSRVYHALYLPRDWSPTKLFPVIVEYAGNGGYRDALGDECTGRPEDCHLGYGMSGGEGFLWICLPYLNNAGDDLTLTWWGDKPDYDPEPTLDYCRSAVEEVCRRFGGDSQRVILAGFSRGAIACNYLGLHDDETAKLWCAFVPCSHYDGVRNWPYSDSDADSAARRLARLGKRPQFVCGERNQIEETKTYLGERAVPGQFTCMATGFRNHSDQWILRPGSTREKLRDWLQQVVSTDDN